MYKIIKDEYNGHGNTNLTITYYNDKRRSIYNNMNLELNYLMLHSNSYDGIDFILQIPTYVSAKYSTYYDSVRHVIYNWQ